jgi:plasmid stabilization system protein ParE
MKPYKISPRKKAERDVEKIWTWYENQKIGLGDEFIDELDEHINKYLTTFPKFAIIYKNRRALNLNRFPHKVIFIINETKYEVIILRVIHPKQNEKP